MLENQLQNLKRKKRTTDLKSKPLILFTNSESYSPQDLSQILPFQTEFTTPETQSRFLNSSIAEEIFNAKFKIYLKNLITKMETENIEILLDYHIKTHQIDRFNKEELLFLILFKFEKYELQIKKLLSLAKLNLNILSNKIKEEGFLEVFLKYFEFYNSIEEVKNFVNKMLENLFEENQKLGDFVSKNLADKIFEFVESPFKEKYLKRIDERSELDLSEYHLNLDVESTEESLKEEENNENLNNQKVLHKKVCKVDVNNAKHDEFIEFLDSQPKKVLSTNKKVILEKTLEFNVLHEKLKTILCKEFLSEYLENKPNLNEKTHFYRLVDFLKVDLSEKLSDCLNEKTATLFLKFTLKNPEVFKLTTKTLKTIKILAATTRNEEIVDSLNCLINKNLGLFKENVLFLKDNNVLRFLDSKILENFNDLHEKIFLNEEELKIIMQKFKTDKNSFEVFKEKAMTKINSSIIYFDDIYDFISPEKVPEVFVKAFVEQKQENSKIFKFIFNNKIYAKVLISHKFENFNFLEEFDKIKKFINFGLLFDLLKDNLTENIDLFMKVIEEIKIDKAKFEILEAKIFNSPITNDIKYELIKIISNKKIDLTKIINEIFTVFKEKTPEKNVLASIVKRYKKLCTPHLVIIFNALHNTEKAFKLEVLQNFNLKAVYECLIVKDTELLKEYIKETELNNLCMKILLIKLEKKIETEKKLCVEILEIILKKKIENVLETSTLRERLLKIIITLKFKDVINLMEATINSKNYAFFENFEDKLFKNYAMLKTSTLIEYLKNKDSISYNVNIENILNTTRTAFDVVSVQELEEKRGEIQLTLEIFEKLKAENIVVDFMQNIINLHFEDHKEIFLRIINEMFNYGVFKCCVIQLVPYFNLMLNSEVKEVENNSRELIEKVKKNYAIDIYELFHAN